MLEREAVLKVYIIGPVTGREDRNLGAFCDAAYRLAEAGYEPVLPHSVVPEDAGWPRALLASVHRMLECDGVAMLTGWEHSQGACVERGVCLDIGLPPIKTVEEWIECSRSHVLP